MNIAESTADWVLEDSPPQYPPPGLGGARIARQEVYYHSPPGLEVTVYVTDEPFPL